jgi:hypothetical protein
MTRITKCTIAAPKQLRHTNNHSIISTNFHNLNIFGNTSSHTIPPHIP